MQAALSGRLGVNGDERHFTEGRRLTFLRLDAQVAVLRWCATALQRERPFATNLSLTWPITTSSATLI